MQFTIKNAPESITVARGFRGSDESASVEVRVADISPDVLWDIFEYGLRQKIADKASGAADVSEASAMLNAAVDQLKAGEWRTRAAGTPSDPMQAFRRRAVRELARANPELAKRIKSYEAGDDRNEYLDTIAANNSETIEPLAERLRSEAEAARKAARTAADELSL